jgi:hypothetical protein
MTRFRMMVSTTPIMIKEERPKSVDAGNESELLKFGFARTRSGQMIVFSVRF